MPDHETVRRMLDAASRDLQAVSNMLDADRFPDEIFGLHAQQALEKSLKAWLAWRDQEVPRTHNLRLLLVLLIHRQFRGHPTKFKLCTANLVGCPRNSRHDLSGKSHIISNCYV